MHYHVQHSCVITGFETGLASTSQSFMVYRQNTWVKSIKCNASLPAFIMRAALFAFIMSTTLFVVSTTLFMSTTRFVMSTTLFAFIIGTTLFVKCTTLFAMMSAELFVIAGTTSVLRRSTTRFITIITWSCTGITGTAVQLRRIM